MVCEWMWVCGLLVDFSNNMLLQEFSFCSFLKFGTLASDLIAKPHSWNKIQVCTKEEKKWSASLKQDLAKTQAECETQFDHQSLVYLVRFFHDVAWNVRIESITDEKFNLFKENKPAPQGLNFLTIHRSIWQELTLQTWQQRVKPLAIRATFQYQVLTFSLCMIWTNMAW